ncbi:MAG: choice-of-anchor J domain-containing protein [Chitinophagaceae bacterium]
MFQVVRTTFWVLMVSLFFSIPVQAQQNVLTEDFFTCVGNTLPPGWYKYSILGNEAWQCNTTGFAGNGIGISGYSNGNNNVNEDWLISPFLDLSSYTQPQLHFLSWTRFNGNPIQVYVSTNYVGLSLPSSASWTLLNPSLPAVNSQYWQGSGSLDLTPYKNQPMVIAFKYTSTAAAAPTWRIDDAMVVDGIFSCNKRFINTGGTLAGTSSVPTTFQFNMSYIKGLFEAFAPIPFEISKDGINYAHYITYDSSYAGSQQTMYVRINPTVPDKLYRSLITFKGNGKVISDKILLQGSSIPSYSSLKTCQWNMRWLGDPQNCNCDTTLAKNNAIQILKDAQADLYALQEVVSTQQLQTIRQALGPQFKSTFATTCSGAMNTGSPNFPGCQKLAYIYDTTKIASMGEFSLLASTYPADTSPYYCFSSGRFPYVMKAKMKLYGGGFDTVYIVNIHGKASGTQADYDRRACGADKMKDSLNALFPGKKILILGDYNDYLEGTHVNGQTVSPYQSLLNSNYTGITLPSVYPAQTTYVNSTGHLIDNVVCSNALLPKYIDSSCFIFTEPLQYIGNYVSNSSDHYPVLSYWRFTFGQQPNEISDFSSANHDILLQNPSHNRLVIHNLSNQVQSATIRVFDLTGKVIWQTQTSLALDVSPMDIGFFPSGLYLVQIETPTTRYHFKWMNQ